MRIYLDEFAKASAEDADACAALAFGKKATDICKPVSNYDSYRVKKFLRQSRYLAAFYQDTGIYALVVPNKRRPEKTMLIVERSKIGA